MRRENAAAGEEVAPPEEAAPRSSSSGGTCPRVHSSDPRVYLITRRSVAAAAATTADTAAEEKGGGGRRANGTTGGVTRRRRRRRTRRHLPVPPVPFVVVMTTVAAFALVGGPSRAGCHSWTTAAVAVVGRSSCTTSLGAAVVRTRAGGGAGTTTRFTGAAAACGADGQLLVKNGRLRPAFSFSSPTSGAGRGGVPLTLTTRGNVSPLASSSSDRGFGPSSPKWSSRLRHRSAAAARGGGQVLGGIAAAPDDWAGEGGELIDDLSSSSSFSTDASGMRMRTSTRTTPKDNSATTRARGAPFSMPKNSADDSMPVADGETAEVAGLGWSRLGLLDEFVRVVSDPPSTANATVTAGDVDSVEEEEGGVGGESSGGGGGMRSARGGGMGLTDPTPVQRMVIPAIVSGSAASLDGSGGDGGGGGGGDVGRPMQHIAFAAATGSGKTLAYLLPILQTLKVREGMEDAAALGRLASSGADVNGGDDAAAAAAKNATALHLRGGRKPKRPRAIILAPTRELAHQILSVVKSLSHAVKLSSALLVGGSDYGRQRRNLDRPLDVVVATPGRLVKHRDAGHLFLGDVRHVVIDEMDTMLEQGFQGDIGSIVNPLLYHPTKKRKKGGGWDDSAGAGGNGAGGHEDLVLRDDAPQVVLTSATMTNAVKRLLNHPDVAAGKVRKARHRPTDESSTSKNTIRLPPNVRILEAPGLHRAVPRLRQVFVDVGSADKLSLLVDVVAGSGGSGAALTSRDRRDDGSSASTPLTLVFCNTVGSCRAAEHALAESGVPSLCYHGELGSTDRAENLRRFRESGTSSSAAGDDGPRVLVCTDIAARGLDVPEVDHVVMFDFPLNPIDYLHRAGRTARGVNQGHRAAAAARRAGSGRVTALVARRDRVLATAIEGAVRRGEPLDGLSSRKSDYLPGARLGRSTSGGPRRSGGATSRRGGEGKRRRNSHSRYTGKGSSGRSGSSGGAGRNSGRRSRRR